MSLIGLIVDETSLPDIKPYIPDYDQFSAERLGWLGAKKKGAEQ